MFKPFKGICNECNRERWIVVRKELCQRCNSSKKKKGRDNNNDKGKGIFWRNRSLSTTKKSKTKKAIQYRRKRTGEIDVFKKMWENADKPVKCQCCPAYIAEDRASHCNFSHVLSKGAFPSFRLEERNIFIVCFACHQEWEFGDRNQPKFAAKRLRAEELKREYYNANT